MLAGLCCVAGVFGAEPLLAGLQAPAPGSGASPRAKVYPNGRDPNAPQGLEPSTPNPKAIELANQKALRADIAKLYEIASDLKNEIDKTDAASTLSVTVVKKAQQIEKLASKSRN
ncbi:MAG: hypothetical protein DMG47_09415 [Acidobacteria bacterium]|nr:MAG: hypothetical protein DMG47_09415 [Acidobacteriota bacterium]